jgi:hypothetical protein
MLDWRGHQSAGQDMYDDLIERRIKNILSDIDEIRGYASGTFSPNDSQARNRLHSIRILCWQILERDEVPGVWKQSFKKVKMLNNVIREIHNLSSTVQADGNEPEYLSKIFSICKDVLPNDDF